MKLTDRQIRNIKPKQKPYKLADGQGLYLEIYPNGSKYWRMKYRRPTDKKEDRLAFGVFPSVSLAKARELRDQAKEFIKQGIDPKQLKKMEAMKNNEEYIFKKIALAWHNKNITWTKGYKIQVLRYLEKYAFSYIGNYDIRNITTKDLLNPVLMAEKEGFKNVQFKLRQYLTSIMRFAVQQDFIKINPGLDMQGALSHVKTTHHPALPLPQLPDFLQKIDNYSGNRITVYAVKITLLTFLRSSEIRFGRWSEIDFKHNTWIIPGQREPIAGVRYSDRGMKMKTPHQIMLSKQAMTIIKQLHRLSGSIDYMFPGSNYNTIIMSENTINKALRNMGYNTRKDICGHGFRTMARQAITESSLFNDDAIERQLSHMERKEEKAAYMHTTEFTEERALMMQFWADYLDANRKEYITPFKFGKLYNMDNIHII